MQRLKEYRTIYDSDIDFDVAKENLIERYVENGEPIEDITDEDVWNEAYFLDETTFSDEKCNLSKHLNNDIIAIADVGTWCGRRSGYKVIGNNLNEVLQSFVDGNSNLCVQYDGVDVISREGHHDGCNHYVFRELKPNVSETFREKLEFKEPISVETLMRNTTSLRKYVKDIYGW